MVPVFSQMLCPMFEAAPTQFCIMHCGTMSGARTCAVTVARKQTTQCHHSVQSQLAQTTQKLPAYSRGSINASCCTVPGMVQTVTLVLLPCMVYTAYSDAAPKQECQH